MSAPRFNVFGCLVLVESTTSGWAAYCLGPEGKRRKAGFEIPDFVTEEELCQYLADIMHESATVADPDAFRID